VSRSQSTQTFNTATANSKADQANAANSYGDTQQDISGYQGDLAKFMSANPYTQGGEYDKTINTGLSNASDAGASALKSSLQSQAKLTGQNSAADAQTAAEAARQNTRDLSSGLASAEQTRMGDEAAYNQEGVQDASVPISAESGLTSTELSGGNTATGDANTASAANKSFFDQLGGAFAGSLGTTLGGGNGTGGQAAKALFS
jgi:hypothetical protein